CAQPLMARLGVPATVRASFGVYNNADDVERLIQAVQAARRYFHGID
ncbi:cysteine sulfinate desulfinase/cysteine desulfurase, partial [Lacticaseibacillus paracasei subsp. paracasei CNCM I-4649]